MFVPSRQTHKLGWG